METIPAVLGGYDDETLVDQQQGGDDGVKKKPDYPWIRAPDAMTIQLTRTASPCARTRPCPGSGESDSRQFLVLPLLLPKIQKRPYYRPVDTHFQTCYDECAKINSLSTKYLL